MKDLPSELIYIVLFVAALLFNVIKQQAARRQPGEVAQDEPAPQESAQQQAAQDDRLEEVWRVATRTLPTPPTAATAPALPRVSSAAPRRAQGPTASPARSRLRVARQSLFGARWDVQEAVVVATILGRCRADEPHDIR